MRYREYPNCKDCIEYDEIMDGILTPCDDEEAWNRHYCLSYKEGIPENIWKGKERCPEYIKLEA